VFCHGVAGDVNFDVSRCTLSGIKKQAMPSVKPVKGSTYQTSLIAESILHDSCFGGRVFISSHKEGLKFDFQRLYPDT
jgi:hypothetical protein